MRICYHDCIITVGVDEYMGVWVYEHTRVRVSVVFVQLQPESLLMRPSEDSCVCLCCVYFHVCMCVYIHIQQCRERAEDAVIYISFSLCVSILHPSVRVFLEITALWQGQPPSNLMNSI